MSNFSKIYWLTRLDSIQNLLTSIIAVSLIVIIIYRVIYAMSSDFNNWDDEEKMAYKNSYGIYNTISIIMLIFSSLVNTFLPSKNDMLLIYAGGATLDYVQKDTTLNKIPYQTTQIVSKYLDTKMSELEKEVSK